MENKYFMVDFKEQNMDCKSNGGKIATTLEYKVSYKRIKLLLRFELIMKITYK